MLLVKDKVKLRLGESAQLFEMVQGRCLWKCLKEI